MMRWIGRLVAPLLSLAVGLAAPAAARASGTATTPAGTSTYAYHAASSTPGVTGGAAFANARARAEGPTGLPSGDVLAASAGFVAAETGEKAALDATPGGRQYTAHYLNDTGPGRNIPGSVVDETIDHGSIAKDLPDRTVFYDPKNDITVVQSKTTGKIMSVRRGDVQ